MKKKKKIDKKTLTKELEVLWKEACLYTWGDICEVCRKPANAFHHFIPRSKSLFLRYDILNGVPVCQSCHSILHNITKNPVDTYEKVKIIREKRGEVWWNYIQKTAKSKEGGYRSIKWIQEQIDKLKKILNY